MELAYCCVRGCGCGDPANNLSAQVKFVRKKKKKKNHTPLSFISDMLTPREQEAQEDRAVESLRPVELRSIGKVYRDDDDQSKWYFYFLLQSWGPCVLSSCSLLGIDTQRVRVRVCCVGILFRSVESQFHGRMHADEVEDISFCS